MIKAFVIAASVLGIYFLCHWLGANALTTGVCMAVTGMVGVWKL